MPDQPRTPGLAVPAEPSPPRLEEVGLALKQLQWRHHREPNQRLASVGLSLVQWDVSRHLAKQPDASLHSRS